MARMRHSYHGAQAGFTRILKSSAPCTMVLLSVPYSSVSFPVAMDSTKAKPTTAHLCAFYNSLVVGMLVYFNPDLNLTLFLHLQWVPVGLDRGYRPSRNLSRFSIICPYPTFASTHPAFLSERVDLPIGLPIYEAHLLELFVNICASQHIWFIFISQALDTVSCTWQELDPLSKWL